MFRIALLAALTTNLLAPSARAAASSSSPFLAVNNSASLSYLKSSLYYIEPGNIRGGNYLDHEDGYTTGARLGVSLMGKLDLENVYFHIDWQGTEGQVSYTGYLLANPPPPVNLKSRATIQEVNLRVGKGFTVGRHVMLTPFIGSGHRHWVRELGLGTVGDYDESYSFFYYSLGGMVQVSPMDRLVLTADAALGRTDGAHITVSIPAVLLRSKALGSSLIQRYGTEVDYRVVSLVHVFAGVNYEYFTFGQSAVSPTGFLEPFSKTKVFDYTIGVRLSFDDWHPTRSYVF